MHFAPHTSRPKLMLSSAPQSRCLSSWRLAHSSFSKRLLFVYLSQILAVDDSTCTPPPIFLPSSTSCALLCLSSQLPCCTAHINLNPTHACGLTQTKETPTRLSAKHCLAASLLDPESLILHSSHKGKNDVPSFCLLLVPAVAAEPHY